MLKPNNSLIGCTGIGEYIDPKESTNYIMTMWRDLNNFILFFNKTSLEGELSEGFYLKIDFYSGGGIVQ